MKLKIAVLAGDGIGPEVTREATNILRAVAELGGHEFLFVPGLIGGIAITETGSPLPTSTLDAALECDAVLLGAVGDNKFNALPPDKRPEAGLLQIRQALGGFANLRPSIAYAALAESSPLRPEVIKDADILFVRELLGGLYFGAPRWWNRETDEAINTMRYTKPRSSASPASPLNLRANDATKSPLSTRPTSSRSRSCGAPPSPRSRRTTRA